MHCDVGLSLHSKIHLLYSVAHKYSQMSDLVSCSFSTIPICPFFNSENFYITCKTKHAHRGMKDRLDCASKFHEGLNQWKTSRKPRPFADVMFTET